MSRTIPIGASAVIGLALFVHAVPSLQSALWYERNAIAAGEFWRLATGHWCHASFSHLFWNLALVAIAGHVLERQSRRLFLTVLIIAVAISGPLFFIFLPNLESYAGLSGLAAGLVAAAVLNGLLKDDDSVWLWVGIAVLLTAKILYEIMDPMPLLMRADGAYQSVPLAHAAGAIAGLLATALVAGRQWLHLETPRPPRCERPSHHPRPLA